MKKRYLIVPLVALCITSNVYAITSNDVTYDNDGTTESLTTSLDTLYSELKKYKTGGSVQSNQMLEGATGYSKGVLVTGTIKSKGATTYTPGTSNQTITAGQYLSGAQTIAGDADLKAANILSGVNIFGVNGAHTAKDHTYRTIFSRSGSWAAAASGKWDYTYNSAYDGEMIVIMTSSTSTGKLLEETASVVWYQGSEVEKWAGTNDGWANFAMWKFAVSKGYDIRALSSVWGDGYKNCSLFMILVT